MNIDERIDNSLNEIDFVLNQKVKVYFVNIVNNKVLVNNEGLPTITVLKKDLDNNFIKEKLEYFMGCSITNLKAVSTVDGNGRYYCFDFVENNILSGYFYQEISEFTNFEFLKLLKDILD